MNVKKILTLCLVCFFAMYSVSFAAVGGKRAGSTKKPSTPTQQQQKAPEKKAGQDDYKPSKDAKSLDKQAPAANSNANAKANPAQAAQPQGSAMGNMMRNVGLFAGGMMLGSMLGSMFGMGEGFFADLLGMLMNGVLLVGIIMVGMMLWRKFKNKKNDQDRSNASDFDRLKK